MKQIRNILIWSVIFFMALLPAVPSVSAEADTSKPQLKSISVSPSSLTAGEEVVITADVLDEGGSGVQIVSVYYTSPITWNTHHVQLFLGSDGKYHGSLRLESYDEPGTWQINFVYMQDYAGNEIYAYNSSNPKNASIGGTDLSSGSFQLIGTSADTSKPQLKSITVSPGSLTGGQEAVIAADIMDEGGSRVQIVSVYYTSPITWNTHHVQLFLESDGKYHGSLRLESYDEPGTWQINFVYMQDYAGNEIYVYNNSNPKNAPTSGIDLSSGNFQLTGTVADTSRPQLKSVTVSPSSLIAGHDITVTADVVDEGGSGVQFVSVYYTSPVTWTTHQIPLYLKSDGKYHGSMSMRSYHELGIWKIYFIYLQDRAGNEIYLHNADNPKVGAAGGINLSSGDFTFYEDVTAPTAPSVQDVTEKSTSVIGSTEADATVTVKKGTAVLGTATAKADGSFSIGIVKQKAGTALTVTAADAAGNISEATSVTVRDVTAPTAPSVHEVTDAAASVTGTAESNATVTATNGATVLGTTTAKADGSFSIGITKQKAGTVLTVTATDAAGNISEAAKVTVRDVTAPPAPIVQDVTADSTSITGTTEAGATVTVKAGSAILGTATAAANGSFTINMAKQAAGTALTVIATDAAGNSTAATITVKSAPLKGWQAINGKWYFYTEKGMMYKGWLFNGGKWYYLDKDGVMKTGWLLDGAWYYLNTNGDMATGWVKDGSTWYYMNNSGVMQTSWVKTGSSWYYLNNSGAMQTGWIQSGGKWYYLYGDGRMAANTTIGSYKLGADGAWIR